jgi:ribosomal protein S11
MKRKNLKHINYNKKNKKITKVKTKRVSLSLKTSAKKRWMLRKKTFSPYPYIITISYYKTNVFFIVADIQGHTKAWTSTGRSGFKNKDKTTYMAVVRVTELFLKKVWNLGIRRVILKFRNLYKRNTRFAVRHSFRKFRRNYPFKYLGLLVQNQMAFNGCRKKKKRRK